jgi:RNA polymerase sigma-70 factor (ECF subfamily)
VAALENPNAYAGRAQLQTWLVGILKHKVVDQTRRGTRETQLQGFDDEPEGGDPSDATSSTHFEGRSEWGDPQEHLSRRQFMAQFDKCLKELPALQQRAFILRNWVEQETDEICDQLGVTAGNLSVMLHRARNRLRDSLPKHWVPVAGYTRSLPQA